MSAAVPAYLAHWGLAEAPFRLEPDPRFAYERADHREGLARILFGITQLGGLVVITGEIGAGKTLLDADAAPDPRRRGLPVAEVPNPPRTAAALLGSRARGRRAPSRPAARRPASPGACAARIADRVAQGRRVVLAIDEAQRLDPRALDEVRLLTNPSAEGPGAPVVLLGQPELTPHIERQPQVAQRVVVRYHLGPMTAEEVDAYAAAPHPRGRRATGASSPSGPPAPCTRRPAGCPGWSTCCCANALFVAAERREGQIGEDTIRDLAEDRRMSVEAASPDGEADRMRRVSYQSVLGAEAGRPRRASTCAWARAPSHPPQGRAARRSPSRSRRPSAAGCATPIELSGPDIDEGAVLRALVDLGMELEIDWAVIARGKALRAAVRESVMVRRRATPASRWRGPGRCPASPGDARFREAAGRVILTRWTEMMSYREGTLLGEDIEELHAMRVSSRRLRAAMDAFEGAFPRQVVPPLPDARSRRSPTSSGDARDLDVAIERLTGLLPEHARRRAARHRGPRRALPRTSAPLEDPRIAALFERIDEDGLRGRLVSYVAKHTGVRLAKLEPRPPEA